MVVKTSDKQRKLHVFLLDRTRKRPESFAVLHPQVVSTLAAIRHSVAHATRDTLWISYARDLTNELVRSLAHAAPGLRFGLFIHTLDMKAIPALSSVFRRIAFTADGGFLAASELADVLAAENRATLFIGGMVNKATETITFWRGNLRGLTVPFSTFQKSGDGTEPEFDMLSVIDGGQTVRLGDYEAAVDAILYEYDPEYRRTITKRRLQEDQSFGASLRRLRKQRGLRREDFEPGISAKTIARIEQGKVQRIQRKTLATLAKCLCVEPDELATY